MGRGNDSVVVCGLFRDRVPNPAFLTSQDESKNVAAEDRDAVQDQSSSSSSDVENEFLKDIDPFGLAGLTAKAWLQLALLYCEVAVQES